MKFKLERMPSKISPCPIAEAIVELRFDSTIPVEVIPGLFFNEFKGRYQQVEKLPIMDLPQVIRDNDPNLKFSPQFRLKNNDFQLQIGPRSFSILCPKEYKGWSKFKVEIENSIDGLQRMNIIRNPIRIGLRYISFFENEDIFEKLNLDMALAENSLIGSRNILRTEFDYKYFKCVVQVANNALLNNNESGSSIDIDIIRLSENSILGDYKSNIEAAHQVEKEIFFSLIKKDFLKKYNPEY